MATRITRLTAEKIKAVLRDETAKVTFTTKDGTVLMDVTEPADIDAIFHVIRID